MLSLSGKRPALYCAALPDRVVNLRVGRGAAISRESPAYFSRAMCGLYPWETLRSGEGGRGGGRENQKKKVRGKGLKEKGKGSVGPHSLSFLSLARPLTLSTHPDTLSFRGSISESYLTLPRLGGRGRGVLGVRTNSSFVHFYKLQP